MSSTSVLDVGVFMRLTRDCSDMIHMIKLPYVPTTCQWIHESKGSKPRLAV